MMWLAVFYIWGSLLAFSECHICPQTSEDAASWVTLKPLGHCENEDNLCPYQLTLPPLSIQLPRPFRELEKMAKELQDLKEMVNQLRRDCQECKDRHSIERGGQKEYSEEKESRPLSPRHNISFKETQRHSGEQVEQQLQGDTSESEGTIKDGMKRLDHSILESQEWNIAPRIVPNQVTTDQRSEMSREVKIFNLSLDETPEDISKVKPVLSPIPEETERELKSKQSELIEPSLPRKKGAVQSSTHGKQQPNIFRDGQVKNISGILMTRRRVQNVPDPNGLSSISRDANTKILDLSTSAGNRRVVKFPGGPLRPKGSYINSRVVKLNNEDRLKDPALVRIHNLQSGDMTGKTEPEEAGFSPVRSDVMRVKETSPRIANIKPGAINGLTLTTDDQNNQDISRFSGSRTDDGHGLKDASQVTKIRGQIIEDNSSKINKTGITRLPTNLRKENQGDVSHIATNKSISNVMNQAEQPNMIKEEKKHMGLGESLVVISSEEETSSNLKREDLTFPGRQVENEKYLNPITETNNKQTDFKILDKADSIFNERRVLVGKTNPQARDMTVKTEPEEAGFSPVRSGVMRVKETSPRIANTKPGAIAGLTLSTDDQNKQDISRFSGRRTDDGHGLKGASQVTKVREDNSRKVNKTGITRLPTNLRKENQGDVSHIATNKSISNVMNQGEQPNVIKEEKKHMGLSEILVVNSSEEDISSNLNREDLTFPRRQVEDEKYLNPITETNNRQTDFKILDKANSTFNERRVLVGKTNPQARDMMVKTELEEARFSPVRSGVMRVKETSPRLGNTKPGAISGPTLSTDDQNRQDIRRFSGHRTDDGHGLKDASQVTKVREDNLRKVNKTVVKRLPTNLRKENQGDVSQIATNKSISSVVNQDEQPNMVKEEKKHMDLSESLVVIRSEEEISSNVDRKDLTFPGRQLENVKYLNPITETNNRQIDSTILDKADSTFNERTVNPLSPDLKDQMQPGMLPEGANEHIGVNSLSAGTMKEDIPSHSKTALPEKDLVKPTLATTVKSKLTDSTVSMTRRVQSPVVGQGTRRISLTPLRAPAGEGLSQNSKKNISKIHGVSQDNKRYVMPNPLRHPDKYPTTVISSRVNKLRQPNVMDNMSANRNVGVHSKLPIPVRNSHFARKNGSGIVRPSYIRKPNFQTQPNTTRGFKTMVSTVTQFSTPTGAREQEQTKEIKHIPQVMRSNVLDNKWLKNNRTESKSQPESQNSGDVQDLDKVQQSKNQVRDNSEIGSAEDPNTLQSGASNSPTGGKESKIFSLGTDDTSNQHPFEVDKISSGKKGQTAPTLKKELSKEPGMNLFITSTVSFMDTDHEDSPNNIHRVTNTHVEMAKNVSWETPVGFENIGATRELELIKFNKDRVEENSGEILSNPNSADTAQGYSRERYTTPVVLETLTNVEEIKGSKLFSLSPEDTAEGFKSHAVSDEVTGREQVENKIHSTCDSDCNTTSTQQSTAQTRPPVDSGREKGPAQDCADYITKSRRNGVYRVTPQPRSSMFPVFCDMESSGGGWTLIQHRFDGSTSFNRTWDEYKNGFGKLIGEFWLGNDKIHLLTKAKNMSLRIEIEDFEGIKEYAHYDHFYVANESQQYRLSIGGYSGTAGNAMQFSKKYDHDQKLFTTPDRDNDQYPSGNCGAYYSSGWWFDACMSANLNGRYYQSKYKGVRNGIFWGTWHNITMEYYPTNERQSFKTVKMMVRPKNYAK